MFTQKKMKKNGLLVKGRYEIKVYWRTTFDDLDFKMKFVKKVEQ